MIIELAIVIIAAVVIYDMPKEPITWALVCLAFMTWYEQGGFMAWHPKNIRKFLNNAKAIGL
jgi:hypothetical protein